MLAEEGYRLSVLPKFIAEVVVGFVLFLGDVDFVQVLSFDCLVVQ